jgi:hypothetical protein
MQRSPIFPPLNLAARSSPLYEFKGDDGSSLLRNHKLDSISDILATLHCLSNALNQIHAGGVEPKEDIWYCDLIYDIQRRLLDRVNNHDSTLDTLETSTFMAALIFSYSCLRDIPFNSRIVTIMVTRLKQLLETGWQHNNGDSPKILWVFAFGGIAAEGRPERDWFAENLGTRCQSLGIRTWKEVCLESESILQYPKLIAPGERLIKEAVSYFGQDTAEGQVRRKSFKIRENFTVIVRSREANI